MARLYSPKSEKVKRKVDIYDEGLEKWDYIFHGTQTPAQLGWVEGINTGTATESTTDGLYRVVATTDFRKNYTYPDSGSATDVGFGVDFSAGFTLEWRAIYIFGGAGIVQSNVYIGDSDELVRCFIDRTANRLDLRWATGVVHISNAVISQWNIYKLVVLGTSGSFYVNGVLEGTFSRSNTGGVTKYLRIDQRISGGGTLDSSIDYIRVRKGTDSTTTLFKNKLTT